MNQGKIAVQLVVEMPAEILAFAQASRAAFGEGTRLRFWAAGEQSQGSPSHDAWPPRADPVCNPRRRP